MNEYQIVYIAILGDQNITIKEHENIDEHQNLKL